MRAGGNTSLPEQHSYNNLMKEMQTCYFHGVDLNRMCTCICTAPQEMKYYVVSVNMDVQLGERL